MLVKGKLHLSWSAGLRSAQIGYVIVCSSEGILPNVSADMKSAKLASCSASFATCSTGGCWSFSFAAAAGFNFFLVLTVFCGLVNFSMSKSALEIQARPLLPCPKYCLAYNGYW